MKAAVHPCQTERLTELRRYDILDTPKEEEFDEIVDLVSEICDVPVAVINFIDADRQWFKAEVGLGVRSTPLETSLCSHVILENAFVEIPDTLADPRMSDNPLCLGEGGFRFYAGALLKTKQGLPLGTLCVLDRVPRKLTGLQRRTLQILARRVMRELELRLSLSREKIMRREVDHRVKNSLASIDAIIGLKARRVEMQETRDALAGVQSQIRALVALHAELHDATEADTVDLARLFQRASQDLRELCPASVSLETTVNSPPVDAMFANAILFIVNEFVANSVKHGFGDTGGKIGVAIESDGTNWRLACEDDGSATIDALARLRGGSGLGSKVIEALALSLNAAPQWSCRNPGLKLALAGVF